MRVGTALVLYAVKVALYVLIYQQNAVTSAQEPADVATYSAGRHIMQEEPVPANLLAVNVADLLAWNNQMLVAPLWPVVYLLWLVSQRMRKSDVSSARSIINAGIGDAVHQLRSALTMHSRPQGHAGLHTRALEVERAVLIALQAVNAAQHLESCSLGST